MIVVLLLPVAWYLLCPIVSISMGYSHSLCSEFSIEYFFILTVVEKGEKGFVNH
jgi:hypothetical protein